MLLFNQFVLFPLATALNFEVFVFRGMKFDPQSIPPWYISTYQLVLFMILEDFAFYWLHRLLHHPKLYGRIHKLHHKYYAPIGLSSEFAHPVEVSLGILSANSFSLFSRICSQVL